jgi:predicted nucleic acid-binding Zn ribbon protein
MPWEPLPSSSEREPAALGESLDRLVRGLGAPSAATVGGLFERWAEVVGDRVADHARPVSLRDGILVVAVDDPAWAPQLRFLEPEILARVREVLGEDDVTSLQVRAGGR